MRGSAAVKALFACAVFAAAGCDGDHIVYRASSDYFPLRVGDYWRYADTVNSGSRIVEVLGDTVHGGRNCIVVADNFEPTYWTKSEGRIEKFVVVTTIRYGEVDTLEQAYRCYYLVPFVVGAAWADTFADTVVAVTDTIDVRHIIEVKVDGLETVGGFTDGVFTDGAFTDVYRLDVSETIAQDDSTVTTNTVEWFAPTVGLVKRAQGGSEELLEDYTLK